MKKKLLAVGLAALCLMGFAGCGSSSEGTGSITMAGSTSMESVAKAWGEDYLAKNGVTISVQGGGSSAGVTSVVDGSAQVGMLSRDVKDEEKSDDLQVTQVAIDGIAIVVNPENGVEELSSEQIADIYTGKITNWKEVGGADEEIVVVGREAGSGTRDGFESILGVEEKCKYKAELNETGQVKSTVASTKGAIGYMSLGYVDKEVKAVKVDGVAPTEATVSDGSYKVQRPFIVVTKTDASDEVKAFVEYMLSDEGQAIVESSHFVKVK